MTTAETKRNERRIENAELKAKHICIDCYDQHFTRFMRCEPCGERNRGGPRKYGGSLAARLEKLNAVDRASVSLAEWRRVYFAKHYCWRRLMTMEAR